jgi:hypothetical protein
VAKLFEVRIKPNTLIRRAERKRGELTTNVVKESNNQRDDEQIAENQRIELPSEKDIETDRGGKREGAGRKPQPTSLQKKIAKNIYFKSDRIKWTFRIFTFGPTEKRGAHFLWEFKLILDG